MKLFMSAVIVCLSLSALANESKMNKKELTEQLANSIERISKLEERQGFQAKQLEIYKKFLVGNRSTLDLTLCKVRYAGIYAPYTIEGFGKNATEALKVSQQECRSRGNVTCNDILKNECIAL